MGDLEEIAALVYRYAELLDGGDLDAVVDLFANAAWRSGSTGEVRRGPEQIKSVYDRVILYDGTPKTRHLITNLTIKLLDGKLLDGKLADGAREATGSCSYTVLQGIDAGSPIETILCGRYHDRYRRGPSGWEFAERVFIVDLVGDQSRHFA